MVLNDSGWNAILHLLTAHFHVRHRNFGTVAWISVSAHVFQKSDNFLTFCFQISIKYESKSRPNGIFLHIFQHWVFIIHTSIGWICGMMGRYWIPTLFVLVCIVSHSLAKISCQFFQNIDACRKFVRRPAYIWVNFVVFNRVINGNLVKNKQRRKR